MKHIRKVELDIDREHFEKIPAVQYDNNSRYLHMTLMSGVGPLDITGHTVMVTGTKPDGKEIFNSCEVLDPKAGLVEVHISEQVAAAEGMVDCNIQLYGSDKSLLSTQQFHIAVGKGLSNSNVESSNEFGGLVDALSKVTGIDNKMNRGEKISTSQIDKNTGKFDESYMTDEFLQQMVGNAPVHATPTDNSITHRKLTSNSIYPEKTTFLDFVNPNLVDNHNYILDKYVDWQTGSLVNSSSYMVTEYLPVISGNKYYCNQSNHLAFFDSSQNFVSGVAGGSWSSVFTVPEGVSYVRVNYSKDYRGVLFDIQGVYDYYSLKCTDDAVVNLIRRVSRVGHMYMPMAPYINEKIPARNIEGANSANNNLVSYAEMKKGGFYNKGVWVTGSYNSTPYIPTDGNATYWCNETNVVCFYDSNMLPIEQLWGSEQWEGNTFTTPSNCRYITVNFRSSITNPKLFLGSEDLGNDSITFGGTMGKAIVNSVDETSKKRSTNRPSRYKQTQTVNMINPETFSHHKCIVNDSGLIEDIDPSSSIYDYGVTDMIEIKNGVKYSKRGYIGHITEFDEYGNVVRFHLGNSVKFPATFEPPTKYIRINVEGRKLSNAMFGPSNVETIPEYSPYVPQQISIDSLEPFKFEECTNLYRPEYDEPEGTAVQSTNGTIFNIDEYQASGYIKVEPNQYYYFSQNHNMALYDEDKSFILGETGGNWDKKYLVPDGVHYMRVTWNISSGYVNRQINKGENLLAYEDPKIPKLGFIDEEMGNAIAKALSKFLNVGGSKLNGLKWNVLGDSITSISYSRPNWWEIIKNKYNMTVNNYGISGTTLSHTHDRHLWDYSGKLDPDEIGYVQNDPSTWHTGNCFVERYARMEDDADIITVMGSTNDGSVRLGEWNGTDTDTLYGALNVLIQGLIKKYPGKLIAFFTPIQSANCYKSNLPNPSAELDKASSTSTLSIQLRAEAIKRKCSQYGIPCLDLFNGSGINGVDGRKELLYRPNDTLHPSSAGNELMATIIENFLLSQL